LGRQRDAIVLFAAARFPIARRPADVREMAEQHPIDADADVTAIDGD